MRRWIGLLAVPATAVVIAAGLIGISLALWIDNETNAANTLGTDTLQPASALSATLSDPDVQLNWTETPSTFAGGYNVYRSTTSGSGYALIGATVGRLTTSYLDLAPLGPETYYYVVEATFQNWTSVLSIEAGEFVPGGFAPPTNLVASPGASSDVALAWTEPVDVTATGYQVYRSVTALSGYTLIATVVGRLNTSYTDTPPAADGSYFYVVDTTYPAQDSDFSNYAARAVLGAVADTQLREDVADDNFGVEDFIGLYSETLALRRGYLRFDVSSLPGNTTINTATLSLFMTLAPSASRTLEAQRADAAWGELTLTWNNQPGPTGAIVTTTTGTIGNVRVAWTVTADVAGFVAGSFANDGWRLKYETEGTGTYELELATREYAIASERPHLIIFYATTTVPVKPAPVVARIGSWGTGTSHTAVAGSNRALVFVAGRENGNPSTLTSVTYGGQALTKVISQDSGTSEYDGTEIWVLNEAGIAAASGSTFVPTWSSATSNVSYAHAFYENVNQAALTGAQASNSTNSSTPNPITTAALANANGEMVVVAAISGNGGSYTAQNGFSLGVSATFGVATLGTAEKAATGAGETPSMQHDDPNRQAIAAFVLQLAP